MKCAYHPEVDSVDACANCGRLVCAECKAVLGRKIYCNPCADKLSTRRAGMGLIKKARTGTGFFVQIIGGILWAGGGLVVFIWTLYVLFTIFGIWTIFVGLLLAPITYLASIFIIWFSTGFFPVILLIPYIASFVGIGLIAIGGGIRGED